MSSMMEWALWYQKQDLSIIPVKAKIPLIKWAEFQGRIASEEEIKTWWAQWPDADIGLVTGERLVLDIDGDLGRQSVLPFPISVSQCVTTKRGMQHHFKNTLGYDKTTLAGILPGVDTRGYGGYVKLPPSQFSDGSGRYEWVNGLDTPLAEPPQWLIDLLKEKNKPKAITKESGESWLKGVLDGIREGNRNESFTRIAGSLRSRGYSASDIYLFLADKAQSTGFDLQELRTITESVGQYQPRVVASQEAQSVSDFLSEEEKVDWLVPGILAKRSIGFIAGLQETCKTWIAMDLAIEVARGGGHWLGKFPVNPGKVLFIDQERFKGETQRRFKALLTAKNLASVELNGSLNITCGSTTRLNMPHSFEAFRKALSLSAPTLVIVDSFATFHTASENDRTEIQKVLELIKQLRNEFGCTFLFINHEGKSVLHHEPGETKAPHSADMMGSIAVPAAAELVLTVRRKDETSSMVYMTKNSLSTKIEPFSVSVVDLDEAKSKIVVRGN